MTTEVIKARGRGRPSLGEEKKGKLLAMAVTEKEFDQIQVESQRLNISRSDCLRRKVFRQ